MEIKFQLVMDKDGSLVDRDATMEKFEDYLTNLCANQEQEQEKIAGAVSTVFDSLKGKRAPMDYVIGTALSKTGIVVAENHSVLYERVHDYLKRNAGEGKLFNIGKGRGHGGIGRIADMAK